MNVHVLLFDLIAPVYSLFFKFQLKKYRKLVMMMQEQGHLEGVRTVMDFGFGTGALLKAFAEKGYQVHGVDASSMMHRVAKRKLKNEEVTLYQEDLLEGCKRCKDDAYDLTLSSYVIHGLPLEKRKLFYKEIKRVTSSKVVFYEHSDKPSLGIRIAEMLEGGTYFSFIKTARKELSAHFKDLETHAFSKRVTVFIGNPD
ncbi:MAG: class I SAM-dependent methyltransferase [Candidatus Izemoplasmataceae bacterium]